MRVWDLNPGYLNRWSLLGEHREIHAAYVILKEGKRGYSRHPETLRWTDHLAALVHRHDLVVSEMRLRGYRHRSPLSAGGPLEWPEAFVDAPGKQLELLKGKYLDREQGRIALPATAQQLWAQHKYSVLARDPNAYRRIGQQLGSGNGAGSIGELAGEFVAMLRVRPPDGRLLNALQHMWGYVADLHPHTGAANDAPSLMAGIRRLAIQHQVAYLMASTALSDLEAWIAWVDREGA